MPQMKVDIPVPKKLTHEDRMALGADIIQHIITRSAAGLDKNNRKFKPYTKEYAAKKGVARGDVDLILEGDLLEGIEILEDDKGVITIGYEEDDPLNGQAEGNITGSYGQEDPNPKKARDYLGISRRDLAAIASRYKG